MTGGQKQTGKSASKSIAIKFKTTINNIAPISKRTLSKNGPYVDAHFGTINKANPIGQTYYLRPKTTYNSETKTLTIKLSKEQPPVHMNGNSVSSDVWYDGTIKIRDENEGVIRVSIF